jgi:hypothetical protein
LRKEEAERRRAALQEWGAFWETNVGKAMGELFADLVALLDAKDPSVVSDYLCNKHTSERASKQKYFRARDFKAKISASGWKAAEVHDLYGPTRSYLGNVLSNANYYQGREQEVAKIVLESMADELAELFANRALDPVYINGKTSLALSPEELNTHLISRLTGRFQ